MQHFADKARPSFEGNGAMDGQQKAKQAADACEASEHSKQGLNHLRWLLLSVVVMIVLVLAMWGRYHQNATSTVDPTKSQPAPGR